MHNIASPYATEIMFPGPGMIEIATGKVLSYAK